jgi:hypothetical protein
MWFASPNTPETISELGRAPTSSPPTMGDILIAQKSQGFQCWRNNVCTEKLTIDSEKAG